uniref:Uncharacterized protein n=1 Tax=Heliothis virescens TaxID=7102 RepID=A0A2A4IZQ9_HELVI
MSSPSRDNEEPSSSTAPADEGAGASGAAAARPPAKRRLSGTVIEISDTDSDDSDVCAVNSYQATADEVKRIRGEDYSSSSSSSEYSSDSESSWEDDSILVEDDKGQAKAVKAQLNPRANRMDEPKFNPKFKSEDLIERLQTHWKDMKDMKSSELTLTCEPFRLCLLHDFLANSEMINNIVDDMNTLDWSRKKMDLYEFHQTADLASLTWQRSIRGIYELLKTEVMSWPGRLAGLELQRLAPGAYSLLPARGAYGAAALEALLWLGGGAGRAARGLQVRSWVWAAGPTAPLLAPAQRAAAHPWRRCCRCFASAPGSPCWATARTWRWARSGLSCSAWRRRPTRCCRRVGRVPARPAEALAVAGGGRGGRRAAVRGAAARAEALVRVPAAHNALSLVYCDAGAAAFTKYVSRLQPRAPVYVLACTYTE